MLGCMIDIGYWENSDSKLETKYSFKMIGSPRLMTPDK
jgi:hypothetical protein